MKKVSDAGGAAVSPGMSQVDFLFKVESSLKSKHVLSGSSLMIDCGATVHVVFDEERFESFDRNFNASEHVIELADGTKCRGIV